MRINRARSLNVLSAVLLGVLVGCTSAPKGPAPEGMPGIDMSGSKQVVSGSETSWEHTPTAADTAFLTDTKPLTSKWATLYVNGLGCPLCASNIDRQLERLPGVAWLYVDLGHGVVQLNMSDKGERPSPKLLADTVHDAGFTLIRVKAQ